MNVTALLAHPDDEMMCAGTLSKFVDSGDNVTLIILFSDHQRSAEADSAAVILGVELHEYRLRQDEFVWSQKTIKQLEPIVIQTNPDLLISHRMMDNNTSHVPLAQIVRTISRKNTIAVWEVDAAIPGGIEPDAPANNLLIDIDKQAMRKYEAMTCYESVVDKYPGWITAMQNRDMHNGWLLHMSNDVHYAEAARIHKSVWL